MLSSFLPSVLTCLFVAASFAASIHAQNYVPSSATPPPLPREFRGAWVASVYNIDWPSKAGLSTEAQKSELRALLDQARVLNLNAIVLQVRPACDALYQSSIEPWSRFLTGTMGKAPEPFYDPLEFAVAEAHDRGIELHAWFNPYRALASAADKTSGNHVSKTHPDLVRRYGAQLWLDPGEPAVRDYSLRVILDVVKRYDIDGVHLDDYFYPYKVKNAAGEKVDFPDEKPWGRFTAGGGKLSRNDWRRDNVNGLVRGLSEGIKAEKPWVKFGISPFGIWRPRVPPTIEAQLDAYDELYADGRLWFQNGWVDYLTPQLYWSIQPAKQSFPVLLNWWAAQNGKRHHLWAGMSTSRIGTGRRAQEIIEQIQLTRTLENGSHGHMHWSMKSLLRDQGGVTTALRKEIYAQPAIIPASPWLGSTPPGAPRVTIVGSAVKWQPAGPATAALWAVQTRVRGVWRLDTVAGARTAWKAPENSTGALEVVAITGLDRMGNAGPSAVVEAAKRTLNPASAP